MKIFSAGLIALNLVFVCQAFAGVPNQPPELWSWFKDLNKSAGACQIQSLYVLDKLKVKDLVDNQHGVYGVYQSNRVVVKCIPQGEHSKLMVAVAGYDRDAAELLRNLIIKEVN